MWSFQQNLKALKSKIKKWNKEEFGNIFKEKNRLEICLQEIQSIGFNEGYSLALLEEERLVEKQLDEREKQEELLWLQKSRIKWLCEGEKNSKFFHHSVIQSRFQNKFYSLKDEARNLLEGREEIEDLLNSHFSDILSDPLRDRSSDIEIITSQIPSFVSRKQNQMLMNSISLQEVQEVVFQMKEGTSHGPDGFTVNFFHHFWEMIKIDVWNIVEQS